LSSYPTHILISKVKTQINPQRPERFSNVSQRRTPIGRWVKKNADIEYPFEQGEVITLWIVYQYTQCHVHRNDETKAQRDKNAFFFN
jgi:hypothetical protein